MLRGYINFRPSDLVLGFHPWLGTRYRFLAERRIGRLEGTGLGVGG